MVINQIFKFQPIDIDIGGSHLPNSASTMRFLTLLGISLVFLSKLVLNQDCGFEECWEDGRCQPCHFDYQVRCWNYKFRRRVSANELFIRQGNDNDDNDDNTDTNSQWCLIRSLFEQS